MKKILTGTVLAAAILMAHTAAAQEQLDFSSPSIPGAGNIAEEGTVQSGHSISASIIGLEYSYEQPLGGYWSVIFRAGLSPQLNAIQIKTESNTVSDGSYSYSTSKSNTTYYFLPLPGLTIEPRYYLNMTQRMLRGKKTANNSANFIAVKCNLNIGMNASVVPVYGIRRGGSHWFREYTIGGGYHTLGRTFLPHANFRIGYTF